MKKFFLLLLTLMATSTNLAAGDVIGRQTPPETARRLTPELLWAMGRIGSFAASSDGQTAVYTTTYYSVEKNKSRSLIQRLDMPTGRTETLTPDDSSESGAVFLADGRTLLFLAGGELWTMQSDGTGRRQLSRTGGAIGDFLPSPDGRRVIVVRDVAQHTSVRAKEADLPLSTGIVADELMYKHWDTYVTAAPHPFVCTIGENGLDEGVDILEGEPYECPMMPFGGVEQLAWSPDGRQIAYTCRKKTGTAYAISTDSDIYLYDIATRQTRNLCKPADFVPPAVETTESLAQQAVKDVPFAGYDQNPQFSPDGRCVAWTSMARDGYESDRARLVVMELATGKTHFVSEKFESGVDAFCWAPDSRTLYFSGVWHGRTNLYSVTLGGDLRRLTDDVCDYSLLGLAPDGKTLLCKRQSMSRADEIYAVDLRGRARQLTDENGSFYARLDFGEVRERWVKTTDGKDMLCWVIYPPGFDSAKKYPALLFCEGGPQSPVSQFWSFRWNFQVMAARDYIIIAPNRRGLPGFGMDWLEEISGDYAGQCMKDYLSAIDDLKREPYVDADRLGAVGASFGGYSVYWLAGNHEGRFKAFIAHDGIFNTEQQYVETEELWFPNWDMGSAPWKRDAAGRQKSVFEQSPHRFVDRWDTPILCIHGQRDFRIEYTQAESAFTAARLRGVPAQLLLFPDENHWVLKPQNGILWQRTFFRWLDRWLK